MSNIYGVVIPKLMWQICCVEVEEDDGNGS